MSRGPRFSIPRPVWTGICRKAPWRCSKVSAGRDSFLAEARPRWKADSTLCHAAFNSGAVHFAAHRDLR
eukprot:7746426-Pyramimonas_sp.AAC.1